MERATTAWIAAGASIAALLTAWLAIAHPSAPITERGRSAGIATTAEAGPQAYRQPLVTLDAAQRRQFVEGQRIVDATWVLFWFESGEWGAGPTMNARACAECHVRGGRGAPVVDGDRVRPMIVRLSIPGVDRHGGPKPHPEYGEQFQTFGVPGVVAEEGRVELAWETSSVDLADGERVELRRPVVSFRDLRFGPLGDGLMTSPRVPPSLVGMGLLDAVPDETLRALAAREPEDGIRGRVNEVWDIAARRVAVGRFGHKANVPNLRQQVAAAFSGDIGVSSDHFPEQNCPGAQQDCREFMPAGRPELGQLRWKAVEFHLRAGAVPARRNVEDPDVVRGEALFAAARCAVCHVPELKTGDVPSLPALSGQVIRPYTDLLLHDLGEGLADGRPDFTAGPRDWRTPALWGLGLAQIVNGVTTYLHDGRARTLTEAILWHGGEAEAARERFRNMPRDERAALLAFLGSL
ncbi:MAG: c-type cytochrome [Burkholderiales bacterium]|nr:c-type cytochrome [Burkholderiales bacterium]